MIQKILVIKNCGRFIDFESGTPDGWDGELAKINTIYGENGMGKTTLAQIFTSLRGNYRRLEHKNSDTHRVYVELKYNGDKIKYNNKWIKVSGRTPVDFAPIDVFDHYYSDHLPKIQANMLLHNTLFNGENIWEQYNLIDESINQIKNDIKSLKRNIELLNGRSDLNSEERRRLQEYEIELQTKDNKFTEKQSELVIEKQEINRKVSEQCVEYIRCINKCLSDFTLDFEIESIVVDPKNIYTYNIKLHHRNINNEINHVLSEGDKTALSLSVFLAYLEIMGNRINDRIIVFDDPFTSFDSYRKDITIDKLSNIAHRCEQFFLFSHDLYFVHGFISRCNDDIKTLKIDTKGSSSCISPHDVQYDASSDFRKYIVSLKNYLDNNAKNEFEKRSIAATLRIIVEYVIRIKYSDLLLRDTMLGPAIQFFRDKVRRNPQCNLPIVSILDDLDDINNYSCQYHHNNPNNVSAPISDIVLRNKVEKTLNIIKYI